MAALADHDGPTRQRARLSLVAIGQPAVASLVEALAVQNENVRWEAAKALSQIGGPAAAPAQVQALEDENFSVRWLAAEGLIAAGRDGLEPLLRALVGRSHSVWLREGAHHVLHTLASDENLHTLLTPVLRALDDLEPALEVPVAAEKALKALGGTAA